MNSRGRISLITVSVFIAVVTGLFLGSTPAHGDATGGPTSAFYTSAPYDGGTTSAGPRIIAATWDYDATTPANSVLRVVFDQAVDGLTVEVADFLAIDMVGGASNFSLTGTALTTQPWGLGTGIPSNADRRVIEVSGFDLVAPTPFPDVGDSIAIATLQDDPTHGTDVGVAALDGTMSTDHARVPIVDGPVLVAALLSGDWYDGTPNTTDILMYFDQAVDANGGVWTAPAVLDAFRLTLELADPSDVVAPADFTLTQGGVLQENEVTLAYVPSSSVATSTPAPAGSGSSSATSSIRVLREPSTRILPSSTPSAAEPRLPLRGVGRPPRELPIRAGSRTSC
jgi:hypothetical protein